METLDKITKKQVYTNKEDIMMLRKDVDDIKNEDKEFDEKIKKVMEMVDKLVATSLTLEVQLSLMRRIVYVLLTALVFPITVLVFNYIIATYVGY